MKRSEDYTRGFMAGMALPILLYFLLMSIYSWIDSQGYLQASETTANFRERTLALVAFGCNIFLVQFFRKHHNYERMRGVIIPTMVYMIIWVAFYRKDLF